MKARCTNCYTPPCCEHLCATGDNTQSSQRKTNARPRPSYKRHDARLADYCEADKRTSEYDVIKLNAAARPVTEVRSMLTARTDQRPIDNGRP